MAIEYDSRGCLTQETIAAFLDAAIDAPARAAVEDHASRCEICRRVLLASARALEEAGPAPLEAPADPSPIRARSAARPRFRRRLLGLAAAAAAVLFAAAVVRLGRFGPAPTAPRDPEVARETSAPPLPAPIRIATALRSMTACGYPDVELARLVARSARAGIRGDDMAELVQAMERAACSRRDANRLRDEVLDLAADGLEGLELRRAIRRRLDALPASGSPERPGEAAPREPDSPDSSGRAGDGGAADGALESADARA